MNPLRNALLALCLSLPLFSTAVTAWDYSYPHSYHRSYGPHFKPRHFGHAPNFRQRYFVYEHHFRHPHRHFRDEPQFRYRYEEGYPPRYRHRYYYD